MGARLVLGVFDQWADLPHPALVLLLRMAASATDNAQPPMSFLGQKELATSLGLPTAATGTVRHHLRTLMKAGAITRTRTGGANDRGTWRSEFRLHVTPVKNPRAGRKPGDRITAPTGDEITATTGDHITAPTGDQRHGSTGDRITDLPVTGSPPDEEYRRRTKAGRQLQEAGAAHHHLSPTYGLDWS